MRLGAIIILCLLSSLLLNATFAEKNTAGKKNLVELRFPTIYFKKNSTHYAGEIWEGDTLKAEATLDRVAEQIKHEKDLVVEIGVRCSAEEKDPKNLSVKRARQVVSDLLKRGVQKKRLVVKGYGTNAPKYTEAEINEAKTEEQKEALRAQNRRCVFGILKWDEGK
jgi:outer membrane protein OmpA-like peptidoglycan-associated protein